MDSQNPPARRPHRGDVLELSIDRLGPRGHGLGATSGTDLSVRGAVPGSRVRAQVTRRRRGRLEARLLEVLDPGPDTVRAHCEHVASCGGCSFQTLAYARQLEQLRARIQGLLAEAGVLGDLPVEPVLGCESPWHYRNKMDFTFSNRRWVEPDEPEGADRGFALGLHVPERFEKVLDVRSCAIHFEEADGILGSVRRLAREHELTPWDVQAHEGLLRHMVLRKGVRTGDIMIDLVTSDDAPEEVEAFARAILEEHPEVTTFVQNVNTRPASVAVGEREHVLFGSGVIHERLLGLDFTISAGSFFQTNTPQAERLFEIVRDEAGCDGSQCVYDLYCGAGAIGLVLSSQAREVWGLESVETAVADAQRNATVNGIENARFIADDVLESLFGPGTSQRPAPDLCVVDPPRSGLHPKVTAGLVELAPERLVYVSCNVAATAADLRHLLDGGYRLARIRPVDLFPHTPHVECVFTLERK